MTLLALDPSALIHRYVDGAHRDLVNNAMASAETWCVSGLARTELMLALFRIVGDPSIADEIWATARHDFDAMVVVPIDERCLARATEIGAGFGLRTVDAVHLAAVDRLPRPARYATLDHRQIPVALALELEVVAPLDKSGGEVTPDR